MRQPYLFINYRTTDTGTAASALAKALKRDFDPRQVFIDYQGVEGGEPWKARLRQHVDRATVLFVLIGKDWLHSVSPGATGRRLDHPDDWVRIEIECALANGATVVPILVDDAPGPKEEDLPASIRPIAELQTRPFRTAAAFEPDVKRLVSLLQNEGFERETHPWRVSADSVYNRVELGHFVGREWLTGRLDEFVRAHPAGYFVVEAQSGMGKTAFLAHLVETRGYVHHFVELQPGPAGVVPGLRNLAAQIVKEFGLEPAWIDDLLGGIGTRADFLERLLVMAASRRRASDPPAVIVVDGLDQAGVPDGQNVLGLPARLPEGFFFVVSQRPVEIRLDTESPRAIVTIDASGDANLRDVTSYVRKWLPEGTASSELVRRSQGNWVYAHHVCREIRDGDRDPADLEGLPRGLWQYYARFWMQWRSTHQDRWTATHLPLLCTLSAAQESLTLPALSELASVDDGGTYRLLTAEWRPFLTVTPEEDGEHFELYHASLRDFVSGSAALENLTSAEQAFASELGAAARARHLRIAEQYLDRWGGTGLETLRNERDVAYRNSYGWRHVVEHLARAGENEAVKNLLTAEWKFVEEIPNPMPGWQGRLVAWSRRRKGETHLQIPRNAWFESHARSGDLALFLADWDRAARRGRSARDPQLVIELTAFLVKSSVRDAALRVPFGLVLALVRSGRWSSDQAIAYARHVADGATRAELLTEISGIDGVARPAVIRDAFEAIDSFEEPGKRVVALARLLEKCPSDWRDAIIAKALGLLPGLEEQALVESAPELVPYLRTEWPSYFAVVAGLRTPLLRLRMLAAAAAKTTDASILQNRLDEAARESLREVEALGDEYAWKLSLTYAIVASLTRADQARTFADEALACVEVALRIPDSILRDEPYEALAVIASAFPDRVPGELLAASLESLMAVQQPREPRPQDFILALQGVTMIEQHRTRLAAKLIAIAPRRTLGTIEKAVLRTRVRFGDWDAYQRLAVRYAQVGDAKRAIGIVRRIELTSVRHRTLAEMAPHLDRSAIQSALAIADAERTRLVRRKVYESERHLEAEQAEATLDAMVGLLPRLAELGEHDDVFARLQQLRAASEERQWLEILSGLARHVREDALNELLRWSMAFRDLEGGLVEAMALAPFLPEDRVRKLVPAGRAIGYSQNTVERISWTRVKRSTSGIRDLDLRRSAVCAIALRLAGLGHHDDALRELAIYLIAADKGRSATEVADCLGEIALLMPQDARRRALNVAALHSDQGKPRALQALAPALPSELLEPALAMARGVAEPGCRAWGIASLLPLADGERRPALAAEAMEHLDEWFWDRWRVLGLLAPHVDRAREEIREKVRAADEHGLSSLVHFLPGANASQADELIGLARTAYDAGQLLHIAEFLPEPLFRNTLDAVLHGTPDALYKHDARLASVSRRLLQLDETAAAFTFALRIRDRFVRTRTTQRMAGALQRLPREDLIALWGTASALLTPRGRKNAFALVAATSPLVYAIGGQDAIEELYDRMIEAGRWWY